MTPTRTAEQTGVGIGTSSFRPADPGKSPGRHRQVAQLAEHLAVPPFVAPHSPLRYPHRVDRRTREWVVISAGRPPRRRERSSALGAPRA